ncbi:MAG: hypothetical protein N4A49_02070 [Marinifilaceae bacterium]|jgi:hypothetical protein|nr:hypothetical protein [Marinifilaceae bacterium]
MKKNYLIILLISISTILSCEKNSDETKIDSDQNDKPTEKQMGLITYVRSQSEGSIAYISKDGDNWEKKKTNLSAAGHRFKRIIYAQNKLWGLKDPGCSSKVPLLMTSTDGLNWEEVHTDIDPNRNVARKIYDIFYDTDYKKFVLCAEGHNVFEGSFLYSFDGIKWTKPKVHPEVGSRNSLIKINNSLYISNGNRAKGDKSNVLISADLENWKKAECPYTSMWNNAIKVDNKIYASRSCVITGPDSDIPQVVFTEDGVNWTRTDGNYNKPTVITNTGCTYPGIKNITYSEEKKIWLALCTDKAGLIWSDNGLNWEKLGKFAGPWLETNIGSAKGKLFATAFCTDVTKNYYDHKTEMAILYSSEDGKTWNPIIKAKGCGADCIMYLPIYPEE